MRTKSRVTVFTIICFFTINLNAQHIFNKKNAPIQISEFMKANKLREIGFLTNDNKNFDINDLDFSTIIGKDRKTKMWGIMEGNEDGTGDFNFIIDPIYDSIQCSDLNPNFFKLKKGDKYGISTIDEIPVNRKVKCSFDQVEFIEKDGGIVAYVRENKRWGLYQPHLSFLSYPCIFVSKKDVPTYYMDDYYFSLYEELREKYHFTGFRPDGNGDGVFYACNSSNKWGLFQMETQIIPMKYDSILPMSFNAPFLIVYNEGKAGVYIQPFGDTRMTVDCIYDELIRFTSSRGLFYCAARNGQKWAIVDWFNGELKTDFRFDSYDDIMIPSSLRSSFYK